MNGRIETIRFAGNALLDNPLGDPSDRELLVYLPPSYDREPTRRFPLVMVLPGFGSTHHSLLNFRPWEPNLAERFERLIASGCPEAILAMPDGFNRWGGSQYIDSPATGDYQRYLAEDVLDEIDQRFRTLAKRASRAVVGKSSGGFGALRLGLDRPEKFAVYASHAGDCAFQLCILPDLVKTATVLDNAGGVEAFVARLENQGAPRGHGEFHTIMMLGLAAAYAPVDGGPAPRGELPFEVKTATLREDVWQRWLAHDPLQMVERAPAPFQDARAVFLDAGKRDEYGLHFAARLLSTRLKSRGVEVHHEEFDGGHMGTSHRYESSLPFVLQALEAA